MVNVKLLVNGTNVDLSSDLNIKLQKEVKDSQDIESRKGDFSYTFDLPFSNANNQLFKFQNDIQINDRYYTGQKLECILQINETPIVEGVLKSPKTDFKNKKYSTNIISNTIDWANTLRERSLQDLESFKGVAVGSDDLLASVQAYTADTANHISTETLVYPLVAYGQYFSPNNELYKNIIDGTPQTGQTLEQRPQITVQDVLPCVYLTKVIKSIFEDVGFKVSGSWINSIETKKLILPYINTTVPNLYEVYAEFRVEDIADNFITYVDELNLFTYSGTSQTNRFEFTVPRTGVYSVSASTDTSNGDEQRFRVTKNGNTIDLFEDTTGTQQDYSLQYTFNQGEVIQFRFAYPDSKTNAVESILQVQLVSESLLDYSSLLPDINQLDFIKSFIKLFNLYFIVDERNKVIYFETFNNFYQDKFNAYDITSKLDIESIEIEQLETPISYNFKYAEDNNDFLLTNTSTDFNYTYFTVNPSASDSTIEVDFAPTVLETFFLSTNEGTFNEPEFENTSAQTQVQIPTIASEDAIKSVQSGLDYVEWEYDYVPRLLKLDGYYEFTGTTQLPFRLSNSIFYAHYWPKATFDETLYYSTLFENNYQNQIREIERSELFTALFNINYIDYLNLTPNRLVKIRQNYYRLIKIEGFNPIQIGLTKIVLQRVIYN